MLLPGPMGMLTGVTLSTDMKCACAVALLFVRLGQPLDQGRAEACGADPDLVRSLKPSLAKANVNQINVRSSTDV